MDDFAKQKINEEKYKKLRNAPIEEYHGDFKSPHIKDVANKTAKQTKLENKEVYQTKYKEDFDKASKDFWQKNTQSGLGKYNGGSLTANFGCDKYTIDEFLERVGKFIKESITNELIEQKLPTEELAENFKAIDVSLKLLANSVTKINDKMSIENVSAFLHGFINTYINNIVKKKLERDKGNVNI